LKKSANTRFLEDPSNGDRFDPCGQRDMATLVSLSNSANAPKMPQSPTFLWNSRD